MIDLKDLAHHLSIENRWAGATCRPFSVAEHSIFVARFARRLAPEEHRDAASLWGLLHDAHEAFLKDLPTPMKCLPGISEAYSALSNRMDVAIRASLGLASFHPAVLDAVHEADRISAWCEARWLLAPCPEINMGHAPPVEYLRDFDGAQKTNYASTTVERSWLLWVSSLLKELKEFHS